MKFRVRLEQDEGGIFVAEVPSVPGCISHGATREEAVCNIEEATAAYLESLKQWRDDKTNLIASNRAYSQTSPTVTFAKTITVQSILATAGLKGLRSVPMRRRRICSIAGVALSVTLVASELAAAKGVFGRRFP